MARKSAFDRYVDEQKKDPAFAAEYKRAGVEIRAIDDFVRLVDAARVDMGMTKADLARKVSMTPEAMRRLLTSPAPNPTFETIIAVLEAVDVRLMGAPLASSGSGVKHSNPVRVRRTA